MPERSGLRNWIRRPGVVLSVLVLPLVLLAVLSGALAAQELSQYGDFPVIGSRAAIWIAAQLHLFFAAFVLGVPMFAVVAG